MTISWLLLVSHLHFSALEISCQNGALAFSSDVKNDLMLWTFASQTIMQNKNFHLLLCKS